MALVKRLGIVIGTLAAVTVIGIALASWPNSVERYVCSKGDDARMFSTTVTPGILLPTRIYVHTTPYRVLTFTGALYKAVEAAPKAADAVSDIEFDTVTGSLMETNRIPPGTVAIVQNACDKKITDEQCKAQMEAEPAGNIFACFPSESDCVRARNHSNVLAMHFYKCKQVH